MKFLSILAICNLALVANAQFPGSFVNDASNLFNDVKNKVGNTVSDGNFWFYLVTNKVGETVI